MKSGKRWMLVKPSTTRMVEGKAPPVMPRTKVLSRAGTKRSSSGSTRGIGRRCDDMFDPHSDGTRYVRNETSRERIRQVSFQTARLAERLPGFLERSAPLAAASLQIIQGRLQLVALGAHGLFVGVGRDVDRRCQFHPRAGERVRDGQSVPRSGQLGTARGGDGEGEYWIARLLRHQH